MLGLLSTGVGCVIIIIKQGQQNDWNVLINNVFSSVIDTSDDTSCHGDHFNPGHPQPKSVLDFGKAFSAIMFSFGGAAIFPTIQADMRDRTQFPTAALYSMISK